MKPALLFFLLISGFRSFSQSKTDTTTILYNNKWTIMESGYPAYVGQVWKEENKWRKIDYYYPSGTQQKIGLYANEKLTIQDGLFTQYHRNGMMSDSILYVMGKKEGIQKTWDTAGFQLSVEAWSNDLPVDNAVWWNQNGEIVGVRKTDSLGSGQYEEYFSDGKTQKVTGRFFEGKKNGKWAFKDSAGVVAVEIFYRQDSVVSVACFDENGQPNGSDKDCIAAKPGGFIGGESKLALFVNRNLAYPSDALRQGIQGVVRVQFTVEKDGTLSGFRVTSSPSELLSREALRILKKSPKWQPAIQDNRPVISRRIQSITFALQ